MTTQLQVNGERLCRELEELAQFSDAKTSGAVTRVVFTATDLRARTWLKERLREAGLHVREDAIGNTFARWEGSDPSLPAVASGSHTDAIPEAGKYDGTVGVLGALEAVRMLKQAGIAPRRSIEIVMFTSEEPTRFGVGCTGSRAMAGTLAPDQLAVLKDPDGRTYDEARTVAGFSGKLSGVKLSSDTYRAFVELHIEQGPILESEGIPIGIVEAIAAPATLHIGLRGEGGHAGAVLMPKRRDALCAAAEIVIEVERAARESGSPDTVATTGILEIEPGAVNSIPSAARLKIDVRDIILDTRDATLQRIQDFAKEVTAQRGIAIETSVLNADAPATCDSAIVQVIESACEDSGIPAKRMISRAYHDSLFMARVAPTAMIFIPCRGGVSHRPDEYAAPEHIATGVEVLAQTLMRLAEG